MKKAHLTIIFFHGFSTLAWTKMCRHSFIYLHNNYMASSSFISWRNKKFFYDHSFSSGTNLFELHYVTKCPSSKVNTKCLARDDWILTYTTVRSHSLASTHHKGKNQRCEKNSSFFTCKKSRTYYRTYHFHFVV